MLKSIGSKKKKVIIITLVMAVCIAAAFIIRNAYLHSKEVTLLSLLVEDAGEIDGLVVTYISGQEPVEVKYFDEGKKVNEIISSLEKTVCRYDGRYKYEVFTGGIEYDISLYKVRDGKNEKLAECSMSTKGELYCNNRKYTIDENESFILQDIRIV